MQTTVKNHPILTSIAITVLGRMGISDLKQLETFTYERFKAKFRTELQIHLNMSYSWKDHNKHKGMYAISMVALAMVSCNINFKPENTTTMNTDTNPVMGTTPDILSVKREFVMQAHAAACADWKIKIEMQFPTLFKSIQQKIMELPEYPDYIRFSDSVILFEKHLIGIYVPPANEQWSNAAYKLAVAISEKLGAFITHYAGDQRVFSTSENVRYIILKPKNY